MVGVSPANLVESRAPSYPARRRWWYDVAVGGFEGLGDRLVGRGLSPTSIAVVSRGPAVYVKSF